MRIYYGTYILDVDIERTKKYYASQHNVSVGCQCSGCRNYEKAVEQVDGEIKHLFMQLAIDMKKTEESFMMYVENGILHYWNIYFFIGTVIEGESPFEVTGMEKETVCLHLEEDKMINGIQNFQCGFIQQYSSGGENCWGPKLNQGESYVQMEVLIDLPWVLEEELDI